MKSHESWSLSPEEFETWDRVYRIKESDGIKEPVLPRVQFETLENLEETPVSSMQCLFDTRPEGCCKWQLALDLKEVCYKNAFLRFTCGC